MHHEIVKFKKVYLLSLREESACDILKRPMTGGEINYDKWILRK